jgi:hypothetical protein
VEYTLPEEIEAGIAELLKGVDLLHHQGPFGTVT